MLRAISDTTLNIDSEEYALDAVPAGLLTARELEQIRSVVPGALPGYQVQVAEAGDE